MSEHSMATPEQYATVEAVHVHGPVSHWLFVVYVAQSREPEHKPLSPTLHPHCALHPVSSSSKALQGLSTPSQDELCVATQPG